MTELKTPPKMKLLLEGRAAYSVVISETVREVRELSLKLRGIIVIRRAVK